MSVLAAPNSTAPDVETGQTWRSILTSGYGTGRWLEIVYGAFAALEVSGSTQTHARFVPSEIMAMGTPTVTTGTLTTAYASGDWT